MAPCTCSLDSSISFCLLLHVPFSLLVRAATSCCKYIPGTTHLNVLQQLNNRRVAAAEKAHEGPQQHPANALQHSLVIL